MTIDTRFDEAELEAMRDPRDPRWQSIQADEVAVDMVVRDPEVGRWMLNPDGTSRCALVEEMVRPASDSKDAELDMVIFLYHDVHEPVYSSGASYLPDGALQVWR
jgi:hypothetical protein